MRFSSKTQLADLQILLNLANFQGDLTGKLHEIMRASGYIPQGEVAHRAVLIVDDHGARVRIRFSFIDDQTRYDPARVLGSFYVKVDRSLDGWKLIGDY